MSDSSVCELVRKSEVEYISGTTHISKHVDFSMSDTINRIEAYLYSKHTTGEEDALGREKPFFNIVVAASNIWMRATDIDRKNIRIRAVKSKDWLDSFMATVILQDWMRRERFGTYLNEWGRTLARYGSAITKFVENDSGLHISVMAWNRMIVDSVDFDANPKIEVIELTEAQLYDRIKTHGYNEAQVIALMSAITTRETLQRQRKDNKTGYIRLYEVHGKLSVAVLKKAKGKDVLDGDDHKYKQQVQVVASVATKSGRKTEYEDFVLYAGAETEDPFRIDHLIKEDGRSIAIGAVEHLFDSQWMQNHAVKTEKDTLDLASRLFFQTADSRFLNMNVIDSMETGDILIHTMNMPLTQVNTSKYDVSSMMNFRNSWKQQGQEIAGISEAMLGVLPKSGTPAAQTQQILQENYSLFELMTENKGLAIEDMMRTRILRYVKSKMDTTREVAAILQANDITRIDAMYMKNEAIKRTNKQIMDAIDSNLDLIAEKKPVQPIDAGQMFNNNMQSLKDSMGLLGSERFFKPSELDDKTWQEQFKDLEWEVDVDVTGENADVKSMLQVLYASLKLILDPNFQNNKKAQAIVGRTMELTGVMSPVEYNSLPDTPPATPALQTGTPSPSTDGVLQT